jgi:hypothetical protein
MGANPTRGEAIPVLAWQPVDGAVSYDMHVEQADGTKRDFRLRSAAFAPVVFYGTGVWHWQVRANFQAGFQTVSGGYSAAQAFTRRIATPTATRARRSQGGIALSWHPAPMAHRYRVEIATDDSFSSVIEQAMVANATYAPRMTSPAFAGGQSLYWRVATIDEGFNRGGWASGRLRNGRGVHVRLRGRLRSGRRGRLAVTVTGAGRRRLAGATVRAAGAGVLVPARHTGRRGRVTLRVRPLVKGRVIVTAEKRGYPPAKGIARVR